MINYKKISSVLIFNDKGELLLQQRAREDNSYPMHWDFSAGGGIDEGEEPQFSAEREVKEELGIEGQAEFIVQEKCVFPTWNAPSNTELDLSIYKMNHNGPFDPDPKEIEKVEFFSLDKITEMIGAGEKFHSKFLYCWNKGIIESARKSNE